MAKNEVLEMGCGEKRLLQAEIFAAMKHASQKRKGSGVPYIIHVVEVMGIVAGLTKDTDVQIAGLLHDTLEDTNTTREELIENFGKRVADLVGAESEDKQEEKPAADTWKDRKQATISHLAAAPHDIKIITLGDKLSNIRAMKRDFDAMGDRLWVRFNQKDPAQHGWYYSEIGKALATDAKLRDTPEFREYAGLVQAVFGTDIG